MKNIGIYCIFVLLRCAAICSAATVNLNWYREVGNQGTTTISAGDQVKWTVTDAARHTVSSTDGGFSGSGTLMGSGATFTVTFNSAGSFPYRCNIHNTMSGIISVTSAPTRAPTGTPSRLPSRAPSRAPSAAASPGSPSAAPTVSHEPTASPTASPTVSPTAIPSSPTVSPTAAPTPDPFEFLPLPYPEVISSGSGGPAAWAATLRVRAFRHSNGRVSFNTRAYCFSGRCAYPGPTISLKPGDNFTLTLVNELGEDTAATHRQHNSIHSPNTTNVHTHGLHISAGVDNVFLKALPGQSLTYTYTIPTDHAPGLHWYHAHHHGSSALQIMGGLVGALIVEDIDDGISDLPASIAESDQHVLVMTRLNFQQETSDGLVTQGCGENFACDPNSQAPLCTGEEVVSPWNLFREYTYKEFAAAAGSTMPIDEEFVGGWADRNYVFINGQHRPTLEMNTSSPSVLRIVHAHGAGPFLLKIANDPQEACSWSVLAWDGVYLDEALTVGRDDTLNVVAAGRVDVQIVCTQPGLFKLVELLETVMWLRVNDSNAEPRAMVSNSDLAGIVRPWYLQDLREKTSAEIDSTYEVFITQENFDRNTCGFWMGVGADCSNISPFGDSVLPNTTNDDSCRFSQFGGSKGLHPEPYVTAGKLVTFAGAVNEWTLYGLGSAFHPLHVHVNHMQIIGSSSQFEDGSDSFYRPGQWRDTIPPVADRVIFRFVAADFTGETVMHCHFQRHEDLGMMDTYLVLNRSAFNNYFGKIGGGDGDNETKQSSQYIWIAVGCGVVTIVLLVAIYFCCFSDDSKILPF